MKAKTALHSLDGSQYLNGGKENQHFELTLERRQQAFVWVLHFWVHTRNEVKRIRLNSTFLQQGTRKKKRNVQLNTAFNLFSSLLLRARAMAAQVSALSG